MDRGSALLHLKFDDGFGNVASNSGSQGSTLNGGLMNMASPATFGSGWTNTGKFGKALSFDGTNDYVHVPGLMGSPANITLSAWVNFDATDTSGAEIISLGDHVSLRVATGLTEAFYYNGSGWNTTTSPTTIIGAGWKHVVYVIDDVNDRQNIYVNGVLIASSTYGASISYAGLGSNTTIGRHGEGNTIFDFNGKIDDVRVYNYPLNADEIKKDYKQSKGVVLGALGTNPDGYTASNSAARSYCPPGSNETNCAGTGVLNPGPIGEWKLDERKGTTAQDTSGNGNTGTLTGGPTWSSGKIGSAVKFDGVNDHILAPNASLPTTDFTYEAWVKVNSTSFQPIFDSNNTQNNEFAVILDGDVDVYTNGVLRMSTSNAPAAGTYHHIAVIRSGATISVYINGVRDQNTGSDAGALTVGGCDFIIGADNNGCPSSFNGYLDGTVDDVRIYNYARTASQVAWDYNRGRPVGWWKFDECTGGTTYDASGNANNGTINLSTTGTQTTAIGNGDCTTNASTPRYNGRIGKYNASLNFDGTDDYVSLGASTNLLRNISAASASVWVNSSVLAVQKIFDISVGTSINSRLEISVDTTNFLCTGRSGDAETAQSVATTGITPLLGTWYHVTCVIDYASDSILIYVNGRRVPTSGSPAFTATTTSDTSPQIVVMGANADFTTPFNGQIDDVRVYNYALTSTQIRTLYNQDSAVRFGPATGAP